jgi:beta-glucosidase
MNPSGHALMSWLILAAPLTALAQEQPGETTTPAPREGAWLKRHEQKLEQVKRGNIDLVFLGDSITQGWEGAGKAVWERYYAPRRPLNLGYGGDRTQHVLWRLDHGEIDGISPRVVVMMIGTNNLRANAPETIADGIKAIVARLRSKLPQTKILLLAVFPRSQTPDELRERARAVNQTIQSLADGDTVVYQDIGPHFLNDDGTISKEIMPDFLHLSPRGYRIWAEAIEPILWNMMNGPAVPGASIKTGP